MTPLDTTAAVLTAIGGVNWGLVALGRFDLVAKLTGNDFGETSAASRLVYGAVGVSAAYVLARLPRAAGS
jgi:uncharacterized membrane protein YuzA (DUF378 family)